MTIYGQNLGGFKRENNESIRNGEKTKLHKIKIVVFLIWHMWYYDVYFVTNMSLWRHNDVIQDKIHVIAPHMPNKKNCNFDFMQLCLFSVGNTFIVFVFKIIPPKFWPYMVIWREIWISLITCNFTPFYPIEMGFSL